MSGAAWVFLVLICGFVWGGFAGLLSRALRSERWKAEHPEAPGTDAEEADGRPR